MKTFSLNECLFCQNEPDLRFALTPCRQCEVCYQPSLSSDTAHPPAPINFGSSHKYVFHNGYETILNANAVCFPSAAMNIS